MYQKEKELNESLVNQSQTESGGNQSVEQIFKKKYEDECDNNIKLQETLTLIK